MARACLTLMVRAGCGHFVALRPLSGTPVRSARPHGTSHAAVAVPPPTEQGPGDPLASAYDQFSATCLYFGIELIDAIGDPELPIGACAAPLKDAL